VPQAAYIIFVSKIQNHNKDFFMKKFTLVLLSLVTLATLKGNSQAIISTENFDAVTYPPTGWSIKPAITPTNVWVRQTTPITNPTATPHSGAAVSRFRSRSVTAGTKQILVTRVIDYTNRGTSTANLDFWMYRDSLQANNQDSLTVWVNSTDTLNATAVKLGTIARNRSIAIPDTQAVNGWYHYTYSIPASFTGTTTRFIFEGTGQSAVVNQGANIYIDDVSFDEFPALCTGTPSVGTIQTLTPVLCGGTGTANLSLTAPIVGLSGISYAWEKASSAAGPWTAMGTATTQATGTITATTYYRCTVNCSYSGQTYTTPVDSIVVTANTPPVISITPASAVFCAGSAGTQLIATGALNYQWGPAATLNVSNNDTVIATPTANTQYIVLGTDSNGCTDTAAVNVTFNAGPTVAITATPGDTACIGSQVILNSTPTAVTGNVYLWSDGITTRRDTITVTATAAYSVIVTNTAGCSNTDTITIVATPPTVANFGYTQSGNTLTFTDSSFAAASWTWSFGDGNGSSSQNPVYTYSAPGTYTITLVVKGTSCNDDSITQVVVVGPSAVSNYGADAAVTMYPNPVQQNLYLSVTDARIDAVSITNQLGQVVKKVTTAVPQSKLSMSVSELPAGVYFAQLKTGDTVHSIRFIKQ
jgi:PKD repeat protein